MFFPLEGFHLAIDLFPLNFILVVHRSNLLHGYNGLKLVSIL